MARIERVATTRAMGDPHRQEGGFDRRIRPLLPALARYARRLQRSDAAEDLVQETLLRAWSSRHTFAAGTNFSAWLFTIMRNAFLTTLARERRERLAAVDWHASGIAGTPPQEMRIALRECEAALARIPPLLRDALVAVGLDGCSVADAATRRGISPGALKSRVFRARIALHAHLGPLP